MTRLEAELAELRARVEQLEARPTGLDEDGIAALVEQVELLLGGADPFEAPASEQTASEGVSLEMFDAPEQLVSLGRAVPHIGPEGTTDGFRMSAIRAGSLPERVGLRNGDLVQTVNGQPLRSHEEAFTAWKSVKEARPATLELGLTRRGIPLTLTIPVFPSGSTDEVQALGDAEREQQRDEIRQRIEERRKQREAEQVTP